jgi:hypothetical protein
VLLLCLNVVNLVRAGTHVAIYGFGLINGELTFYRIDATELGPFDRDIFSVRTTNGYNATGWVFQRRRRCEVVT